MGGRRREQRGRSHGRHSSVVISAAGQTADDRGTGAPEWDGHGLHSEGLVDSGPAATRAAGSEAGHVPSRSALVTALVAPVLLAVASVVAVVDSLLPGGDEIAVAPTGALDSGAIASTAPTVGTGGESPPPAGQGAAGQGVAEAGGTGQDVVGEGVAGQDLAEVPGSTRLAVLGPLPVLDTRPGAPLGAEAAVPVPLPSLPGGSTAVLLEVSLVEAADSGPVTLVSSVGEVVAVRLPGPGAMTSSTVVVPIGPDGGLTARTEGGGHLVVTLVGAFEPAVSSSAGRVVPVPATEVLRLVPERDGGEATIELAGVPALGGAGTAAAVLLQVAADVGDKGGSLAVGSSPDELDQQVFWSATVGDDRVRGGFVVVPVSDGAVSLEYKAGRELRVDLVGYVTNAAAPESSDGLVVPLAATAEVPVTVPAGEGVDVALLPEGGLAEVGQDRVIGAVVGVTGQGETPGGISVRGPDSPPGGNPTLSVALLKPRSTVTVVPSRAGEVRVSGDVAAQVTVRPIALVVGQG